MAYKIKIRVLKDGTREFCLEGEPPAGTCFVQGKAAPILPGHFSLGEADAGILPGHFSLGEADAGILPGHSPEWRLNKVRQPDPPLDPMDAILASIPD